MKEERVRQMRLCAIIFHVLSALKFVCEYECVAFEWESQDFPLCY